MLRKEIFLKLIIKSVFCSDDYPVYVFTQQNGIFDNDHFQLRAGSDTLLLPGVLCENGMYHEGFKYTVHMYSITTT